MATMTNELSSSDQKVILDHLNEVAPDTYNEGEDGAHTFKAVARSGSTWVVEFEHDFGDEAVKFEFDGEAVVDELVEFAWVMAFNDAYNDE